jgi:Predicted metal-dependent hydrolase
MWIDATRDLANGGVVYPGDYVPKFNQEDHGKYLLTEVAMSTHSGTHIDAPSHYLKNDMSVDKIPFSRLIGRCRVIDLSDAAGEIGAGDLSLRHDGVAKILIKTSFSGKNSFSEDYPALSPDAARVLTEQGIECVGIDSPSIESFTGTGDVHRELLGKGVVIIELLDMSAVREGYYEMIALPLRLTGLDGSPCRVILKPAEEEGR